MWDIGHVWARLRPAAVVLALAVGAGLLAAPGPEPTVADIRLFQFNMCGHSCRAVDADKVSAVVNSLADFHPMAVSLNEVCDRQLAEIHRVAGQRGWSMSSTFMVTRPDGCGGGADYGIALLTRSRVVDADRLTYVAQRKGTVELRGLLCVKAHLAHRQTRICTTHIVAADEDPHGDIGRAQIASAASLVGSYSLPVVLMGDFNARPSDGGMSALYTRSHGGGAYGELDEVDQGPDHCRCGEPTQNSGAKYDYIFATARDFDVAAGDVTSSRFSDHDALRGWIAYR